MIYENNEIYQKTISRFKLISDHFIGLKATLFAYSPGFRELYISFRENNRVFLLKFSCVTYIKVNREWTFTGFAIKQLEETVSEKKISYRFCDQNHFEVICCFVGVVELMNGQDIT